MAMITPRRNKDGKITSWLVTIYGGYGPDGINGISSKETS